MNYIGFFDEVLPAESGGKARNLISLFMAGFPVPPGFVLTYHAFRAFQEKQAIPAWLDQGIRRYYRELCRRTQEHRVAVRSSASAEDCASASFAGIYDTFLYIAAEAALLESVSACFASLSSPRAILYRRKRHIPGTDLRMAVLVQQMIDPQAAGVLFTRDPASAEPQVMAVESTWGCCDLLVSGRVVPDHFEVKRGEPFEVINKVLGKKEIILAADRSPSREIPATLGQQASFSLTDKQLARVCSLGEKIENHFGSGQDIEWAIDREDRLFVLQARPITRGASQMNV